MKIACEMSAPEEILDFLQENTHRIIVIVNKEFNKEVWITSITGNNIEDNIINEEIVSADMLKHYEESPHHHVIDF